DPHASQKAPDPPRGYARQAGPVTTRRASTAMPVMSSLSGESRIGLNAGSLDHLVGEREQRERERDAERLRSLEVEHQLVPSRLLHAVNCVSRRVQWARSAYPRQNTLMASWRAGTLEKPRAVAAAGRPPNCSASAETLLP